MAQDINIIHNDNFNVTNEYSLIIVDGYIIGITSFGYNDDNTNLNNFISDYLGYQNDGNMPNTNESDYEGYLYMDCNIDYAIGLNKKSINNNEELNNATSISDLYPEEQPK